MVAIQNMSQAVDLINKFIPANNPERPYNLENIRQLMDFLGNPQNQLKIVHIAGTSGKTSTAYYTAALLRAAGYKVGLSVSPHIDSIRERAQIDMELLPEGIYCKELGEFLDLVDKSGAKVSYFEVLVAFMFWLFERQKVDWAVVEVGLGGLLDGTNVVNRDDKICTITDIGFDHTEILGDTLSKIASQKAGIIMPGNRVFVHQQTDEVLDVIKAACDTVPATLTVVKDPKSMHKRQHFSKLPAFGQRNFSLALQVVDFILDAAKNPVLDDKTIVQIARLQIPARMEAVNWHEKTVVMDGSHNQQKLQALADAMKQKYAAQEIVLVVSFGNNKQSSLQASLDVLRQISSKIIITAFSAGQDEIRKSIEPDIVAKFAKMTKFESVITEPSPTKALELAKSSGQPIILITGSFFLLNHIRPIVLDR